MSKNWFGKWVFLLPVIALFLSIASCKQDNLLATSADHVSDFFLEGKVVKNGNIREAWIRKTATRNNLSSFRAKEIALKTSHSLSTTGYGNYIYTMAKYQFDCEARKYRVVAVADYAADGKVLNDDKPGESPWLDIVPQSVADMMSRRICGE